MSWAADTAAVTAVVGLVAGAFVPWAVGRLPEPDPEPEDDGIEAAEDEADFARPIDEPKEPYADIAATPRLAWWTALASAVLAGTLGGQVGWSSALPYLVFLVPVGVALSVVDWRTRLLPTAVIAPSYVVVGLLVVLASALSGDWHRLLVAVIGWVATFVVFFVLWWVYPRGLGYGDVRLSGLLGLALGWLGSGELVLGMYTGFLLGGLGGGLLSVLRVFHRKHYPFGPFMLVGAWLAAAFPTQLAGAYGAVVSGVAALVTGLG